MNEQAREFHRSNEKLTTNVADRGIDQEDTINKKKRINDEEKTRKNKIIKCVYNVFS